jgi:phenylalanine-4-hydroxylase
MEKSKLLALVYFLLSVKWNMLVLLGQDFEEMETHPYDVTKYQPILYVWDSFEELYEKTKEFAIQWGTDDDPRKELHQ